jgi:uncharacterized integral membrane protein
MSASVTPERSRSVGSSSGGAPRTRLSTAWMVAAGGIAILGAVLIFILENLHTTETAFLGVHWRIPLGVDLLLAALLGATAVLAIGAGRILQLRLAARRRMPPASPVPHDGETPVSSHESAIPVGR